MKIFLNIIIFYFTFQNYAFAYLDPGTGSAIIAAIISSIAISIMYLRHYTRKILDFFRKIFSKRVPTKNKDKDNNDI